MNAYHLIISPDAENDIEQAYNWYETQKEGLGAEFFEQVKITFVQIENNPKPFFEYKPLVRRAIVKRFPYGIFFYLSETTINVFAVFHSSRNPMTLGKRYKKEQ